MGSGVVLGRMGAASFLIVLLQLQDSPAHPFGLRDLVLIAVVVQNFLHTDFHPGGYAAIFRPIRKNNGDLLPMR